MTPPEDDPDERPFDGDDADDDDASGGDADADEPDADEPYDEPRDAGMAGDDDADDQADDEAPEEAEPGYLWTFGEQEERLGDEYERHMEILDEMEVGEILDIDFGTAGDYIRWAAAQSLEEQGWTSQAIDVLRTIGRGAAPHPALSYPDIGLRLHDLLRERGDYAEALTILEQVERDDPGRRDACRERRAEVLILNGRPDEGLKLFETSARAVPDDPWLPLTAAWALIRAGDYDGALFWIAKGERAARRLEDEEELRSIDNEVERLRNEARIRSERKRRTMAAGEGGEDLRQSILAALDREEVTLTRTPPQSDEDRSAAIERLSALHQRASKAWDDAVERHEETSIAKFDDLQWEVVEVAERFGLKITGVEE
ncbi:MAG TPA: tetratricopeptide repeat protein [Candidatus Polarisedimenticolia bacterium]|nr:tetratricopeptide repeat protein [Candidatus Polarisedimenticolia bacterium]